MSRNSTIDRKYMNRLTIKNDFVASTDNLLNMLSSITEQNFNKKPIHGGWTAGMTVEHLIKVEYSTLKLFSGPVEQTERDPEQKIQKMKNRLLDFNTAMTAFGSIIPDDEPKDKSKALGKIQDIRQKLTGLIEIQDLAEMIIGFEHPLFGFLTRVEWIYFNIYHSRRHINQVERIMASIEQETN